MADEASVRSSLNVNKGNVQYRSYPTDFTADMTGSKGPTPGSITVTGEGTDVDLSELTTPGFCRVINQGDTYTVMLGVWNGTSFMPAKDLLPGEHYVIRLSQFLGEEFGTATSTATTGTGNTLRLKCIGGSCNVLVEVFER
jgi:hypothetical protein